MVERKWSARLSFWLIFRLVQLSPLSSHLCRLIRPECLALLSLVSVTVSVPVV